MSLSEEQKAYFENLFQSRKLVLDKNFQRTRNSIFLIDLNIQHQWFKKLVEDYAKGTIDSRVKSFIETCRKFSIFPSDNDLQSFIEGAKPYVMNKANLYQAFCENPFGPDLPSGVADSILQTLNFDLQGIFREAIYPVEQLFLEGRIVEGEKRLNDVNAEQQEEDLISKILMPLQRKWLEAIYARQKRGETITTRELMVELENELPKDFNHHGIGGAFLRGDAVTILGIALLDPEARIICHCNKVIESVWTLLRQNPQATQLKSSEISSVSGLDLESTEWALRRIGEFTGIFHNSGKPSDESEGWSVIDIDERAFNDYRKYRSLEAVLPGYVRNPISLKTDVISEFSSNAMHSAPQEPLTYTNIKGTIETLSDNDSKDQVLIGDVYKIVGEAGQLFRQFNERDKGIDGEIEFVDKNGDPSGERVYLQLKSGDSYLRDRKSDKKKIFQIKKTRWATYWRSHKYPVMLVIRTSDGRIRWMNITAYIEQYGTNIKQIEFQGEPFTANAIRQMRDSFQAF
jgi:hypothetical protein